MIPKLTRADARPAASAGRPRCWLVVACALVASVAGLAQGRAPGFAARAAQRSVPAPVRLPVAAQETDHLPPAPHTLPRPGYLGVSLRDLDAADATRLHVRGAMIVTVDRDAPAWTAGLRARDVVVELNGLAVDGVETLRRRLRECPSGNTVTLRVRRGGEETSFAVVLGDPDTIAQNALNQHLRPVGSGVPAEEVAGSASSFNATPAPPPGGARGMASTLFDALMPGSTYTGLEVNPLTPQLAAFFGIHANGGLLVTDVRAGSPAAGAGLTAGDVIVRAGRDAVPSRSSLAHALRAAKGGPVALAVLRDHKELMLSLLPGKRKRL